MVNHQKILVSIVVLEERFRAQTYVIIFVGLVAVAVEISSFNQIALLAKELDGFINMGTVLLLFISFLSEDFINEFVQFIFTVQSYLSLQQFRMILLMSLCNSFLPCNSI